MKYFSVVIVIKESLHMGVYSSCCDVFTVYVVMCVHFML
jgi:hypothetical protein